MYLVSKGLIVGVIKFEDNYRELKVAPAKPAILGVRMVK